MKLEELIVVLRVADDIKKIWTQAEFDELLKALGIEYSCIMYGTEYALRKQFLGARVSIDPFLFELVSDDKKESFIITELLPYVEELCAKYEKEELKCT